MGYIQKTMTIRFFFQADDMLRRDKHRSIMNARALNTINFFFSLCFPGKPATFSLALLHNRKGIKNKLFFLVQRHI